MHDAILEPELPIFDPHHHFRDSIGERYLMPDLERDLAGHRVVGTLFVECGFRLAVDEPAEVRSLGETRSVTEMAAAASIEGQRRYLGIIGFVDLTLGDRAAEMLELHVSTAGDRLRGIRNVSTWDADETLTHHRANPPRHLLSLASFRAGFTHLERYGLSFDAWLYHTQIDELVDLARAFPETAIVLNHVGGPVHVGAYAGRRAEVFGEWRSRLRRLSQCPNVFIKLGGLGMRLGGFDIHDRQPRATCPELAALWRPYIDACIEIFGTRRAMFESNFPVDREACDYATLWNVFKQLTKGFSPTERADLFGGAACRAYRLPASVGLRFAGSPTWPDG